MPDQSRWGRLRIPTGTEAHTVPADLGRMADDIDPQLVLKAASVADRDARYGTAPNVVPPRTHVAGPNMLWRRNEAGTGWDTVWSNGAPQTWTPQRITNDGTDTVLRTAVGSSATGVMEGLWSQDGRVVDFAIRFVFGGSEVGAGLPDSSSGYWRWTLPVTSYVPWAIQGTGTLVGGGNGPTTGTQTLTIRPTSNSYFLLQINANNGYIGRTQSWAEGDQIRIAGSYWSQ